MLSLYTLKSAGDASNYYQQGDYYTQDGASHYSRWEGKGALKLGLEGSVDFGVFKALLEGRLPNGEIMTQVKKGGYHRPGYDLTFSAPKSVSILALVTGNKAVLTAHREAVQETLQQLESRYAGTRLNKKGHINIERTQNLIIATFEHSDSRAGDPNLHTHGVVLNITESDIWRALYADEFYQDKLFIGMLYRSALAQKLMRLGYELVLGAKGTFEIKGVPHPLITFFSKRRTQIEEWLKEHGLRGSEAASRANFATRAPKKDLNPLERQSRWLDELKSIASLEELKALEKETDLRGPVLPPHPLTLARQAIHAAMLHVTEKESSFVLGDLMKAAKLLSVLPVKKGDLLTAFEEKIVAQKILGQDNNRFTTRDIKALTREMTFMVWEGKKNVSPVMAGWSASMMTAFKVPHRSIRQGLIDLLTTTDRTVLLKSTPLGINRTLKTFIEITKAQYYYPRVLTQTKIQVETLKNKLGTDRVSTLAGFLLACEERSSKKSEPLSLLAQWEERFKQKAAKDIWIVEGGASLKQIHDLQRWAQKLGARIILTETYPLSSLEPLKAANLKTIDVLTVKRSEKSLKITEKVLAHLKRATVHSIPDNERRLQSAVNLYLSAPPCLLATVNHHERITLNTLVRDALKQRGTLSGQGYEWNILQPLSFTIEEKTKAHLYQPGYILRFNRDHPTKYSLQKGSYFTVHQVDLEKNILILHQDQTEVFLNLEDKAFLKQVEVFKKEPRELRIGDMLIGTRTVSQENTKCVKGQKYQVIAVNEQEARLSLQETTAQLSNPARKEIDLNPIEMKGGHWDYGYAVSLWDANLKDIKTAVLMLPSQINTKTLLPLQDFLQASKVNHATVHLVCPDIEQLKKGIEQSEGFQNKETLVKAPYQREAVLADYPTLVTEPLFQGLQGAYLNATAKVGESIVFNTLHLPENTASIEQKTSSDSLTLRIAADIVDKIALYHAEREAVFNLEEVKKEALKLNGLGSSIKAIEQAFELAINQGLLVVVSHNEQNERLVAAKHTVLMEEQCIALMKAGQNQVNPILPLDSPLLKNLKTHPKLTTGQKEAITLILSTQDRMVAIQGIAGAGKTSALTEIKLLCDSQGFQVKVLANTGSAANQAKQKSDINTQTTASFLIQTERALREDKDKAIEDFKNHLIIVDESSLAATQDFFRLQTLIQNLEARLILIGDFKQQGSIGAGLSFHDFLAYGIQKAVMAENVRLKHPTAFTAMKKAYANDIKGTLQTLTDSIEEIPDKVEALTRIADVYCALRNNFDAPLIITPRNEDRHWVNNAIRERLKEANVLTGEALEINVFLPVDRREVDKTDVLSYKPGDTIRFNTSEPRLNIKAGSYAIVMNADLKHQRLTLKIKTQEVFWSPHQLAKASDIEIYRTDRRALLKNDIIVFKRTQKDLGIFNGDKGVILKIEGMKAEVLLANQSKVTLDFTEPKNQHIDYGYALTVYLAQSKDVNFVIAYGGGPKAYIKDFSELRQADAIILPKGMKPFEVEQSRVVKIINITDKTLTLQDRIGKVYQGKVNPKSQWGYFPPFEARKLKELPLSTSLESFIITITRGDGLLLIVSNLDDFQKTLESHNQLKRSALSYSDPSWQTRHQNVVRLVQNIRGFAAPKEEQFSQKLSSGNPVEKLIGKPISQKVSDWNKNFQEKAYPYIDCDAINHRLNQDILGYATQWLGTPKKISGVEARWPGTLTVNIRGPKVGMWKRWSTDEGGKDLISLYSTAFGLPWFEALQALAKDFGIEEHSERKILIKIPEKLAEKSEILDRKAIQKAKQLYNQGIPILGTLAEKYLREHRGITGKLPIDFRFIASTWHFETKKYPPALLAPIRDKDHSLIGVLRIFLNPNGSKYNDTYLNEKGDLEKAISKANLGLSKNGAVIVQQGALPNTLYVAEGIETALSVAQSIPKQTVMASLSVNQFKNIPISPEVQKIIICADKDESSSQTSIAVVKAIEHHLSQGKRVFVAIPPGSEKCDFNDLLQQGGITAVKKALNQMLEIKDVQTLKESSSLALGLQKIRGGNETRINASPHFSHEKTVSVEKSPQNMNPPKSKNTDLQINR